MSNLRKRAAMLMAVLAAVALSTVMSASPAAAAFPTCNTTYSWGLGGGQLAWVPAYGSDTSCNLRNGNYNNDAVETLQLSLNECYLGSIMNPQINLTVDGDFGPATVAALKRVQAYHGIAQDGIYGPWTRDRMWHVGYPSICGLVNGPGGY